MTPEQIRELFDFNAWANQRMLDACGALTGEQFTRDLGSSFRSVRDTLTHIVGSEWVWLERWHGRSPEPNATLEKYAGARFPDLSSVRAHFQEIDAQLVQFVRRLSEADLGWIVEYVNFLGHPFAYPLHSILRHLVNHGTYHRGQVTAMLRQLGAKPGATDLGLYYHEHATPAEVQAQAGKGGAGMTLDETRVLYDFNAWANHRVLESCGALTDEQFTRDLGSSFPSVRDTLVHMMGGEWLWLANWRGHPSARTEMETQFANSRFANLASVRTRWEQVEGDLLGFVRGLAAADLDKPFEVKRHQFTYPLQWLLQHLVNHGTYHRGQVTTMLRQLGVQPRATDYLRYFDWLTGQTED
jgi:uncharacterized damage-inducible protein DinB